MKNCKKCQKEVSDSVHYLYNTYCKECWPDVSLDERKSLEGFCKVCGDGWNYLNADGSLSCLNCYRQIHGKGTFPEE